ncbi:hypothetical protein FB446DRAFT_727537 [Lentinula raphanica]|nr:hypothetical protein FB446DRAFT_727537 [Lentinula raphanica]
MTGSLVEENKRAQSHVRRDTYEANDQRTFKEEVQLLDGEQKGICRLVFPPAVYDSLNQPTAMRYTYVKIDPDSIQDHIIGTHAPFFSFLCPTLMSLPPSRTVPPSFVRPYYSRVSLHLKRDDGDDSDDDDDDDDHSNSSTHSKSPQSTHSQSSQNGDGASQNDSNQITSSKTNAGAIAGGVIAGIIVLAVLAFFWWKRRSFRRNRHNVKIEIDPTSALNGEAYLEPQTRGVPKDEEQSLMYERTSTVDADTNPRPSQPQFWRVYNVSESDDVSDAPIARNIHGVREKDIGERHLKGTSGDGTSSANIIPVPEKDFGYTATGTSTSKAGLRTLTPRRYTTQWAHLRGSIKKAWDMEKIFTQALKRGKMLAKHLHQDRVVVFQNRRQMIWLWQPGRKCWI